MTETDWEQLTFWEKFTDKDSRRPKKTWRSRVFWTFPIHTFTETVSASRPRIEKGTFPTSAGDKPCLNVRTTKFKGKTYKDKPLYHGVIILWNGWLWGWK